MEKHDDGEYDDGEEDSEDESEHIVWLRLRTLRYQTYTNTLSYNMNIHTLNEECITIMESDNRMGHMERSTMPTLTRKMGTYKVRYETETPQVSEPNIV